MAYLKYTSLLIFWGWILSVAYIRYILPFIESALDAVDTIEQGGGAFRRGIAFATKILMAGAQMYVWAMVGLLCHQDDDIWLAGGERLAVLPDRLRGLRGFLGAVAKKEKLRAALGGPLGDGHGAVRHIRDEPVLPEVGLPLAVPDHELLPPALTPSSSRPRGRPRGALCR